MNDVAIMVVTDRTLLLPLFYKVFIALSTPYIVASLSAANFFDTDNVFKMTARLHEHINDL